MLAAAALVAFAVFAVRDDGGATSLRNRLEECARSPAADRCFRREYAAAASRGEVVATLSALEALARDGKLDDCHLQAHRLAHAVYRVVGDVERTFLLGGRQCRLGYLHGAVEASGAGEAGPPPCERFRISWERGACSHGFGHALMLRTGHDLRASVAGCRAAARGIDRVPCERGVMMQNSLRYSGRADFAGASLQGCEAVDRAQRLRRLCVENVGVVAALSLGHDARRASAACRRVRRADDRATCLTGMQAEIREARGSH